MFDHVGIAVSDLAASERFYRTVLSELGVEPSHADAELVEWEDWDVGPVDHGHSLTRGLHVGFRAPDRAAVDGFWQAGVDGGHPSDGAPGPRTAYGPDYYGAFLLDPDGNSVEAVHADRERPVPDGSIDHLRFASATRRRRAASTRRSRRTPGCASPTTSRIVCGSPAPTSPSRWCATSARSPSTSTSRSPRTRTPPCGTSTPPRWPRATKTTAAPASAACTTRATTAPSCSTRTATTSRSSTTTAEQWAAGSGFRPLSNHVGRAFVVAQPEEARLTQPTVARPFGEPDLCDDLGLRPVCSGRHRASINERRLGRLQCAQPLAQVAQRRDGVAGAHLPGVPEPIVLVVADEQRPEFDPASAGIGVPADHQLLLPRALQLQPVP